MTAFPRVLIKKRVSHNFRSKSDHRKVLLYAIRNPYNNRVKIGVTVNIEKRMQQYRSHCGFDMPLLACWYGTRADEKEYHRLMKLFHVIDEWYEENNVFYSIIKTKENILLHPNFNLDGDGQELDKINTKSFSRNKTTRKKFSPEFISSLF